MTIIIYRIKEDENGDLKANEIGRWKAGIITHNNGKTVKMSRKEVIRRNNNGYYATSEIRD